MYVSGRILFGKEEEKLARSIHLGSIPSSELCFVASVGFGDSKEHAPSSDRRQGHAVRSFFMIFRIHITGVV